MNNLTPNASEIVTLMLETIKISTDDGHIGTAPWSSIINSTKARGIISMA